MLYTLPWPRFSNRCLRKVRNCRFQHTVLPAHPDEYSAFNEQKAAQDESYGSETKSLHSFPQIKEKTTPRTDPLQTVTASGSPLQHDFSRTTRASALEGPAVDQFVERKDLNEDSGSALKRDGQRQLTVEEGLHAIRNVLAKKDDYNLLENIYEILQHANIADSIPTSTYLEILRRSETWEEFIPFRSIFAERYVKHYGLLGGRVHRKSREIERRKMVFARLWKSRVESGRTLSTREYAQILKFARGAYDGVGASIAIRDMLSRNVKPDLACYNYYFEAKSWSDAWYPDERQRLRVIPFHQKNRTKGELRRIHGGIEINPHCVGPGGLKEEVTQMFTHMVDAGVMPDSTSYGHLITALAREGNLQGVKATLHSIWDVDVDATSSEVYVEPSSMPQSSPFYPNQSLLFIIAHAFGSNNDLPKALRAVGQFSEKYALLIDTAIWAELLECAYMLSTKRYKNRKFDGAQSGQLAPPAVEDMFKVLTGEPYNCEPTLHMLDRLIRSLARNCCLSPMLKYITLGLELYHREHQRFVDFNRKMPERPSEQQRQEALRLRDDVFASFASVHNWFLLLLSGQRWYRADRTSQIQMWQRQLLPDVVDLFWRYRPLEGIKYAIKTGFVELRDTESSSISGLYIEQGRQKAEEIARSRLVIHKDETPNWLSSD
ncbi:uncharacterized protein KY384_004890 [Bacidia gigantensis]|uniref:uncharacterized protein n=1 Tax=Bacidia gigantensis TaxID=2732470 RepID=UPI001D038B60|nr:uncharacterized protein KY384_004890 [Bacidia gigantensis]KAG8530388.1 hypothetical protein KY384_004890 [Bacidia gigantensis]